MNDMVLAADLGGTNLRMALVDDRGAILHLTKSSTPNGVGPGPLVEIVDRMANECFSELRLSDFRQSVCGIGFTAPAPVAKNFDGVLTKLPNLPGLVGMNLMSELEKLFGLPVVIENDATAAGIGEDWIGASKDVETSICVTLGTGIGGGIVIDKQPIRGKDGIGGEIGHICVEPDGHQCGCGSHGCIEQYASATAIVRMAREAGMDVATSRDVYDADLRGDVRAGQVFRSMGRYLGITLAGLANALNPDMLVICGGVTQGWDAFAKHVEDEISSRAYPAAAARGKLERGTLGDNAGVIGVARSTFLSVV